MGVVELDALKYVSQSVTLPMQQDIVLASLRHALEVKHHLLRLRKLELCESRQVSVRFQELCLNCSKNIKWSHKTFSRPVLQDGLSKGGCFHPRLDSELLIQLSKCFVSACSPILPLLALSHKVKCPLEIPKRLLEEVQETCGPRCWSFLQAVLFDFIGRDNGPKQLLRVEVVKQSQPRRQTLNKLRPVADLIHSCGHLLVLKHWNLWDVVLGLPVPNTTGVFVNFHWLRLIGRAGRCCSTTVRQVRCLQLAHGLHKLHQVSNLLRLLLHNLESNRGLHNNLSCLSWLRNWVPWIVSWHLLALSWFNRKSQRRHRGRARPSLQPTRSCRGRSSTSRANRGSLLASRSGSSCHMRCTSRTVQSPSRTSASPTEVG